MSKTTRRTLPATAFTIAAISGLAAATAQLQPQQPQHPLAPVPANQVQAGQPDAAASFPLTFDELTFTWGDIPDTEKVSHVFKFKNTSGQTVHIKSVNGSCGCTVPTLSKMVYEAGETGEITATFDPAGRLGVQAKTVTVALEDPSIQPLIINISSNVKPFVYVDSAKVQFNETMINTEAKQTLHVIGRDPEFKVTSAEAANREMFSVNVLPSEPYMDGEEKLVRVPIEVTFKAGSTPGIQNTQITINTNDTRKPTVQSMVGGMIVGESRVSPQMVIVRTNAPSVQFEALAQIDNRLGKSFEIKAIDVEGPTGMNLAADFEPQTVNGNPGYLIKVVGVTPGLPGQARGQITLLTDIPGEAEIKIPLYANIVANQAQIQQQATKPAFNNEHAGHSHDDAAQKPAGPSH
ncbi:MAG: DUF1573 domain-containing protein [Phycisphaeraceae bacterium]|nr:DUF1573 domain-containing protein [Phycisphaeraceae bacterium]